MSRKQFLSSTITNSCSCILKIVWYLCQIRKEHEVYARCNSSSYFMYIVCVSFISASMNKVAKMCLLASSCQHIATQSLNEFSWNLVSEIFTKFVSTFQLRIKWECADMKTNTHTSACKSSLESMCGNPRKEAPQLCNYVEQESVWQSPARHSVFAVTWGGLQWWC